MQNITYEYDGKTYQIKPTFDLFMRIEERLPLNRLAIDFKKAQQSGGVEIPLTHISWTIYCCLVDQVDNITPMDVHRKVANREAGQFGILITKLIIAYFGQSSEDAKAQVKAGVKKKTTG